MLTEDVISDALTRGCFEPYFQPVMDTSSGQCIGAEVLARLVRSEEAVYLPSDFLAALHRDEDLLLLTQIILKKTAALISELSLPHGFMLTFNIPANLLGDHSLLQACGMLSTTHSSIRVVLEITEYTPLTLTDARIKSGLAQLRRAGIRLALDDFGMGYAGLDMLRRLPFSILKISGTFSSPHDRDYLSALLLDNILHLVSVCGLQVISEGVESSRQSGWLHDKGVTLQQGYLFSPPLNGAD